MKWKSFGKVALKVIPVAVKIIARNLGSKHPKIVDGLKRIDEAVKDINEHVK